MPSIRAPERTPEARGAHSVANDKRAQCRSLPHGGERCHHDQPRVFGGIAVSHIAFWISFIGFVMASLRDGLLGTPWIAWLAIIGAAAHGAAAPLVVAFGIQEADFLFALLLLCALWLLFVALSRPRLETHAR